MNIKIKFAIIGGIIIGILLGAIFIGLSLNLAGENIMIKEIKSPYDDFQKTVNIIKKRINSSQKWKVLKIYDYRKIIKDSGNGDIGNLILIKFCASYYAAQMLKDDNHKKIAVMLPKTVAIYEKSDGRVYVSLPNGAIMGKLLDSDTHSIVEKVSLEIEDIMKFLNFKFTLF